MPLTKNELKEKLARGRLESVLESLREKTKDLADRSLHRDADQLSARFNTVQRDKGLGLSGQNDWEKILAEIRAEASRLLDELPDNAPASLERLWLKNPPALRYRDVAADRQLGRETWQNLRAGNLILHGTGGMGKTTVAKIIVGEYGRHFQHVAWLEAADGLPSQESLLALLAALPGQQNLLIVDDLQPEPEQIVQLEQLRERLPGWRILVTSRGQFTARGFMIKPQPLVPTSRQARRIFRHYRYAHSNATLGAWLHQWSSRLRRPTLSTFWKEIDEFSREVGCNTLALEVTAKTLRANPKLTLAEFRRRLNNRHLDDRDLAILFQTGYLKAGEKSPAKITAYKCLCLAFEQATELSPDEQRLLKILILLPPLSWARGRWVQALGLDADGNTDYVNAENALIEKGWLEWDAQQLPWWRLFARRAKDVESHYRLHPLVRQMLHYVLRPGVDDAEPLLAFFDEHTESQLSEQLERWIAAVDYLLAYDGPVKGKTFWAENLFHLTDKLSDLNRPGKALPYATAAEALYRGLASQDATTFEWTLAKGKYQLGLLHYLLDDYKQAGTFLQAALEIQENLAATDAGNTLDLIQTQRFLANLYFMQQDRRAVTHFHAALRLLRRQAEQVTEETDSEIFRVLNRLGQAYRTWGRYNAAEQAFLQSLVIMTPLVQAGSEEMRDHQANVQESLAILYHENLARPEAAEELLRSTLSIREALALSNFARFAPDLAFLQRSIGIFYNNSGRYPAAEDIHYAALQLYENLVEAEPDRFNGELASAYCSQGLLGLNQGHLSKAREYFEKAEEIYVRIAAKALERFNKPYAELLYFQGLLCQKHFISSGDPSLLEQAWERLELAQAKLSVGSLASVPDNQKLLGKIAQMKAWLQAQEGGAAETE